MIVRPRRCISPQGFLALLPRHRSRLLSEMHRLPHQLRHGIWEWYLMSTWQCVRTSKRHVEQPWDPSTKLDAFEIVWTNNLPWFSLMHLLPHALIVQTPSSPTSWMRHKSTAKNQNISARITERVRTHCTHNTFLHKLHWLPVIKRTRFKVLLLTYKALHD